MFDCQAASELQTTIDDITMMAKVDSSCVCLFPRLVIMVGPVAGMDRTLVKSAMLSASADHGAAGVVSKESPDAHHAVAPINCQGLASDV